MTKPIACLLIAVFSGNALSCAEEDFACTLMACSPSLQVTLSTETGALADGSYTIALDADGEQRTCTFSVPEDLPEGTDTAELSCGSGTPKVSGRLRAECGYVPGESECQPIVDRWVIDLSLLDTPRRIAIEAERDGVTLLDSEFFPQYEQYFPNGPRCGGACSQGEVYFVLDG